MRKYLLVIGMIIFTISGSELFADQYIRIANHSFAVITEDDGNPWNKKCEKVSTYIKNENCIASYKTAVGDVILGEGQINFKPRPQTIQLGKTKFRVGCQVNDDLTFCQPIIFHSLTN